MAPAGQRRPRGYSSIRRTVSLLSILHPLWNKHSDQQTICIHGKVKLVSSSPLFGSCPDCRPWILPSVDMPCSGRRTICIHGKVKLVSSSPFVRLMSRLPPLAPAACGAPAVCGRALQWPARHLHPQQGEPCVVLPPRPAHVPIAAFDSCRLWICLAVAGITSTIQNRTHPPISQAVSPPFPCLAIYRAADIPCPTSHSAAVDSATALRFAKSRTYH